MQAALIATTALAACETAPPAPDGAPVYDCVETRLLDGDLVNFRVAMRNATHDDVTDYAECAAAQYALIRGYGFARHKGYATREHLDALRKHGPCPLHRTTFAPVREMILQPSLPGFEP